MFKEAWAIVTFIKPLGQGCFNCLRLSKRWAAWSIVYQIERPVGVILLRRVK